MWHHCQASETLQACRRQPLNRHRDLAQYESSTCPPYWRCYQNLAVQVTAYYAPQFEALREMVVEGAAPVFTACLSRCKKWLSRGGKSAVYFAKTQDERYVVKQLTRSEKQSFLDFAPAYFRCCPALAVSYDHDDPCCNAAHMQHSHIPVRQPSPHLPPSSLCTVLYPK